MESLHVAIDVATVDKMMSNLESLVLVMTENPELRYHPKGLQYGILSQA
jgi:hypothetical protein